MNGFLDYLLARLGIAVDPSTQQRVQRQLTAFLKTLLGTLGTQAGTYFSLVLLTRYLGVEGFGRYAAIQATLMATFGLSSLGIGVTSTRFVARFRLTDPARAGRISGLCSMVSIFSGLVFTAILLIWAEPIAIHIFRSGDLHWAIRTSSVCCLLLTWNAHQVGTLMGFEAFGRLLRAQLFQSATALVITLSLVLTFGFIGAVIALPLATAMGCFYLHRELKAESDGQGVVSDYINCWSEHQVLVQFALPAAASGMIGSGAVWCAQMLLVNAEAGLAEMGLWTAAASIRGAVLLAPGVLSRVSSPILSSLHDHDRGETYSRTLWSTAMAATGGALAAGLMLQSSAPLLLRLFGKDFLRVGEMLPLVIASAVVEAYACSVSQALVAHGRLKYQLGIIAVWSATLLLAAWTLIPRHAASGLAFAYLLAWLGTALGYTWIARHLIAIRTCQLPAVGDRLRSLRA